MIFLQVWDVVSPKLCAETVLPASRAADAAHRLVDLSLARRSTDNVSVVIAGLRSGSNSSSPQPQQQQQPMAADGGRARSPSLSPGLSSSSGSLSLSPASLSVSRTSSSMSAFGSPYAASPAAGYSPSFAQVLQF